MSEVSTDTENLYSYIHFYFTSFNQSKKKGACTSYEKACSAIKKIVKI